MRRYLGVPDRLCIAVRRPRTIVKAGKESGWKRNPAREKG
jgi:hypothetical protein